MRPKRLLKRYYTLLPFLKPKKSPGVITVSTMDSKGSQDIEPEDHQDNELEVCAEDFMRAITNKDAKGLAMAIKAAVELVVSKEDSEQESE